MLLKNLQVYYKQIKLKDVMSLKWIISKKSLNKW